MSHGDWGTEAMFKKDRFANDISWVSVLSIARLRRPIQDALEQNSGSQDLIVLHTGSVHKRSGCVARLGSRICEAWDENRNAKFKELDVILSIPNP